MFSKQERAFALGMGLSFRNNGVCNPQKFWVAGCTSVKDTEVQHRANRSACTGKALQRKACLERTKGRVPRSCRYLQLFGVAISLPVPVRIGAQQ
jgi:hypothetical protein